MEKLGCKRESAVEGLRRGETLLSKRGREKEERIKGRVWANKERAR